MFNAVYDLGCRNAREEYDLEQGHTYQCCAPSVGADTVHCVQASLQAAAHPDKEIQ